ncbi:MAG: hypothetical protein GY812_16140 [Actinomycetia bacterium]|nr:hypothetical protein [Actinomycetes bacterium]
MRNTLLVIHIIAVAAWLGANLTMAFAGSMTRGADVAARRWWAAAQGNLARVYKSIAATVVLITGVWLVLLTVEGVRLFEFSDPFVSIGFLVVIVGAGLGIFVFGPGCRQIVASIDSGDAQGEARATNRLSVVGLVDTLLVVLAIVAMVGGW